MSNSQHQREIRAELSRLFGEQIVIPEWNVAKNSADLLPERCIAPIDFAVGPFNPDKNVSQNNAAIDATYEHFQALIAALLFPATPNDSKQTRILVA